MVFSTRQIPKQVVAYESNFQNAYKREKRSFLSFNHLFSNNRKNNKIKCSAAPADLPKTEYVKTW